MPKPHLLDTEEDIFEQIVQGLGRLGLCRLVGHKGAGGHEEVDEAAAQPPVELGLLSLQFLKEYELGIERRAQSINPFWTHLKENFAKQVRYLTFLISGPLNTGTQIIDSRGIFAFLMVFTLKNNGT